MSGLKVLVVGASVAGPMTAYWLAKAGANVTIIERFSGLRTGGQSIDIRDSGVKIMQMIPDMETMVRGKSTNEAGMRFVDGANKEFGRFAATGDVNNQSITSEFEIFRGDLARIMFDLTEKNERISYVFGEEIASMEHRDGTAAKIEFANGYPTQDYDLVVVCDGATSRTRAMAFECNYREHIRSMGAWAAFFTVADDLLEGSKLASWWRTVGGKGILLRPDPAGTNRATFTVVHPVGAEGEDVTLPFRNAMKQGDDTLKQYITDQFKGSGWKCEEILQNMMTTKDFYASEIVQVKCPTHHRGRVVLVGDAGYCPSPFSGAGTTLAITGAYLLAGELSACNGNVGAGLQEYEKKIRPYITKYQNVSPSVVRILNPQSAWGVWLGNLLIKLVSLSKATVWAPKIIGPIFGHSSSESIPDYTWMEK